MVKNKSKNITIHKIKKKITFKKILKSTCNVFKGKIVKSKIIFEFNLHNKKILQNYIGTRNKFFLNIFKILFEFNKKFNDELIEYINYMSFNVEVFEQKVKTFISLENIIVERHRLNYILKIYGSFMQGLYTKYSDIDVVVNTNDFFKDKKFELSHFKYLSMLLYNRKYSSMEGVIAKAKYPILKYKDNINNTNIDISINKDDNDDIFLNSLFINEIISKYRILHHSIIILKLLLKINEKNGNNPTGMSSFLLFHFVYFFFFKKKIL